MLVLASTAVTVVIIIAAVVVVGALAIVLGRRTPGDEIRENVEAEQGPLGVEDIKLPSEPERPPGLDDEARLDRENE
jgi:hypothetical protein